MAANAGWKTAITEWLASKGYPAASIDTPMDARVDEWWSYVRCEAPFYSVTQSDLSGKPTVVKVRSMTPAAMVCEDMAGMILNEDSTIGFDGEADRHLGEWLDGWLRRSRFQDGAPALVYRVCTTGTGGWAHHLKGLSSGITSPDLEVVPQRYDARSIVPLGWEDGECTECAFLSSVSIGGKKLRQLELHRPGSIETLFVDEDGDPVVPEGYISGPVETGIGMPTFALARLAIDNPYWEGGPFGVSLIDRAIGAIETADLAFDAIGNEIVLGKKMVFMPESMLVKDEKSGKLVLPQQTGAQCFVALKGSTVYDDGSLGIKSYSPDLRADDEVRFLSTALQSLGKRCGFGTRYYSLDQAGNIATAKEVASDNAEMMRTVRKHCKSIRPAIARMVASAAALYRNVGGMDLPEVSEDDVAVVMGDSIIQDEDSLRDRDRADVAIGAMPLRKYIEKWQGVDEQTAAEWEAEAQGQTAPGTSPADTSTTTEVAGKALNGSQTQSLIAIISQLAAGSITEGQAVNLIMAALGIDEAAAKRIIDGNLSDVVGGPAPAEA